MVMSIDIDLGTTWALPFGQNLQFPDGRRDGDADSLEYLAAISRALAADGEFFPVFLNGDLLERFEILFYVRPLKADMACGFEPPVEFFSQGERKETAEDMTPDGFISLVENGPCIQERTSCL